MAVRGVSVFREVASKRLRRDVPNPPDTRVPVAGRRRKPRMGVALREDSVKITKIEIAGRTYPVWNDISASLVHAARFIRELWY